jgi:hypothetical protein
MQAGCGQIDRRRKLILVVEEAQDLRRQTRQVAATVRSLGSKRLLRRRYGPGAGRPSHRVIHPVAGWIVYRLVRGLERRIVFRCLSGKVRCGGVVWSTLPSRRGSRWLVGNGGGVQQPVLDYLDPRLIEQPAGICWGGGASRKLLA